MRLNNIQIKTIKKYTSQVFGKEAKVYLFGSRINDEKKGGDIDLLVVPALEIENERAKVNELNVKLILSLGDQKIDIVVKRPSDIRYITEVALKTGIEL